MAAETCGHGRSATRRHARPIGVWRRGSERRQHGVLMAAGSTTVGARR